MNLKVAFTVTSHHFVGLLVPHGFDLRWLWPWVFMPKLIHQYSCSFLTCVKWSLESCLNAVGLNLATCRIPSENIITEPRWLRNLNYNKLYCQIFNYNCRIIVSNVFLRRPIPAHLCPWYAFIDIISRGISNFLWGKRHTHNGFRRTLM